MGLSSQLAPSAIARPGVCTSSTRPASPYQGQVIYQTDTNTTLVWNGSGWVLLSTGTANPVGLEFITSNTFNSVTSTSINNCFTSGYVSYKLTIQVYGSTNTNCQMRLRSGGVDASGTDYYDRGYYNNAGTITSLLTTAGVSSFVGNYSTNAGYPGRISMDVHGPQESARTVFHTQWTDSYTVLGGDTHSTHATGNSYDGFSLLANSGTFSGTIRVYGYRNS